MRKKRKLRRNNTLLLFGAWILIMVWIYYSGFTYDTATITTLLLAVFGYIMHIDSDIARLKESVSILLRKNKL